MSYTQLKLVANSRNGDLLDLVSGGEADHGAILGVLDFSLQVFQFQPLVDRLLGCIHILPIQVIPLKVDQPLHPTLRDREKSGMEDESFTHCKPLP